MKKDTVKIKVIVPENLGKSIEKITHEQNISKNQFVREALESYLLRSSITAL